MESGEGDEEGPSDKEEKEMKKIGEYTARGSIDRELGLERITLFDGRFDTAYRVVSIKCTVADLSSANEAYLVCSTEPTGISADLWDWGSNIQMAWAYFKTSLGANEGGTFFFNVDEDNLVIEDLYLQATSDAGDINYEIAMEKYDISESRGALAMVRNRSQA